MRDDARALKERGGTDAFCAVDDLVGDSEVAWLDLLAQGSNSRECDNEADTKRFESGNVCAGRDSGGGD